MKKSKNLLIGFILLWVVGFLLVWGVTLFKKKTERLTSKAKTQEGIFTTEEAQLGAFSSQGAKPESEAIPARCFKIAPVDFKDELNVMGTVKGELEIDLKFEINGIIESIYFREGDIIYKGDLIASLNKKDAQLKIDYSKSKLETARVQTLAAEKKLEIHKRLYDIGGIIKAKLEEAELEVKSARSQAESAKVELKSSESEFKKTDLYAPREGVLGSKDAEAGELVTPNNKIATLYDIACIFVELGIVERDIDKITLGQEAKVKVDSYPGADFAGTVDNIFPLIEGKSRTLTVRVGIENPDALLLPGMFARARITVAEFQDALVVPSISLNKTDEGYKIFIVNEDNTVSSRTAQVVYVTTDFTVLSSGVYEGDIVVIDTPQELKDGMSVKIIEVQESAVEVSK
ncbi:MAG: efflux RND transporter periplasmic adaptor subunit [Candidatus Omnitrophica bacterium]|nr:efflux RND transporter periplasmic adaptor subunit [Candidatus Omnitrophota bacterium]